MRQLLFEAVNLIKPDENGLLPTEAPRAFSMPTWRNPLSSLGLVDPYVPSARVARLLLHLSVGKMGSADEASSLGTTPRSQLELEEEPCKDMNLRPGRPDEDSHGEVFIVKGES
ncbi:unnamed protein product [Protopolystoma xenopodis]|uniref:Uncharacterized protein n=1 Tax=Protopolystoma xenopodis TaxID=117903 RepID=A0A448WF13_9PLAT|nr:unnamed protein product [Protopolystoma xenopodis]